MPSFDSTTKPINAYPACAILEYASSRFILVCCCAAKLPSVIVITQIKSRSCGQSTPFSASQLPLEVSEEMAGKKKRVSSAKPAALDPIAKKVVIGIGAPVYTSGAHMWNGTDATL